MKRSPAAEHNPDRSKVLVVDDRPENLLATRKILERLDADTVTVNSGNEALRAVLHDDFAVVLMDVQMPNMDGFETAALLRANENTKHLPIIFVTAISKEERYVFEGYDSGAVDYLFKPIDPRILLAKTRVFLQLWQNARQLQRSQERLQREIAQRKEAERQLRIAQRLEALGRLVAGVGHEINNPLAYVLTNLTIARGHLERAQNQDVPPELGEVPELLAEAEMGANRIRRIVRSLRRFSMMTEQNNSSCDVRDPIDLAIQMLGNQLRDRARMVIDLEDAPPVRVDAGLLEQVLVNILMNALEALPECGAAENEIRVATRVADESRVIIEVTDNGCGISSEGLDRIFDPFFTTKVVGKGTGLGLSICHEIVTSSGGDITVTSEVGKGTTLRVSLPAAEAARDDAATRAPEQPSARPGPDAGSPVRILVVDDEPLVLRALRRQLDGHDAVMTTSGREAARLCTAQEFDLILADLMMPEVSGVDLFHLVQKERPGTEKRIVFMTGGAFTASAQDFLATVSNMCLEKPLDHREMQRLLSSAASRARVRPRRDEVA